MVYCGPAPDGRNRNAGKTAVPVPAQSDTAENIWAKEKSSEQRPVKLKNCSVGKEAIYALVI